MIVLLANGEFAYITEVCNCEKCKERGEAEFRIEDKNGNYIDYIKFHELYDSNIVRYYNQKDLCELLHKKLMEVER